MSFKQRLAKVCSIDEKLLPGSYQIIGDVLLLKFMKIDRLSRKKSIAAAILDLLPYVKTVCEISKVESEFRIPRVRKLAGNGTVTTHREHDILYRLDASKIMFSKGNLFERQRLIKIVKPNETVVDMFAGIGYFSLGLAKKVNKVIAIEKNPLAFGYMKENIKLNKINNIEPILGDNRKLTINGIADRIIMGYFQTDRRRQLDVPKVRHFVGAPNGSERFLPFAVKMLKNKGVIHFHNVYRKDELWHKPIRELEKLGVTYRIIDKKIVKSVAPNTYHVVLDINVRK